MSNLTVPGKGGSPLKFRTVKSLQLKIGAYFESCWAVVDGERKQIKPYTVSGLAVFLGTDRTTLLNYQGRSEFFNTVKKAKDKIEAYAEEQLYLNPRTAGVIFSMVNNYKWQNAQRQEIANADGDKPFTIEIKERK